MQTVNEARSAMMANGARIEYFRVPSLCLLTPWNQGARNLHRLTGQKTQLLNVEVAPHCHPVAGIGTDERVRLSRLQLSQIDGGRRSLSAGNELRMCDHTWVSRRYVVLFRPH